MISEEIPLSLDFSALIVAIRQVHEHMETQVGRAVNISLTLRNWVVGCYLREYEQNGSDRAKYGDRVLKRISKELYRSRHKCYSERYLRLCRQLYSTYPQMRKSLISRSGLLGKRKSLISELPALPSIGGSRAGETASSPQSVPAEELLEKLSFTHFVELIKLENHLKRTFYELECLQGNWSVRELKRQIGSLYFERSGLSLDKEALHDLSQEGAEHAGSKLTIRDPYIFEFLGLKPQEVMRESDLEDALLDQLQEFLLELGHGFCFEARQKRILIGDTHGFVDLIFYHRILKCHVLVELKTETFTHENIGQLNTYVSWYRKNMMVEGDNPPIGILLCTQKDHTLVEYALAGMDNQLFVSKYQLALPEIEEMQQFLEEALRS
jgi:predicted nuclease of restriction endonuclease-like (RecB) superfamily